MPLNAARLPLPPGALLYCPPCRYSGSRHQSKSILKKTFRAAHKQLFVSNTPKYAARSPLHAAKPPLQCRNVELPGLGTATPGLGPGAHHSGARQTPEKSSSWPPLWKSRPRNRKTSSFAPTHIWSPCAGGIEIGCRSTRGYPPASASRTAPQEAPKAPLLGIIKPCGSKPRGATRAP